MSETTFVKLNHTEALPKLKRLASQKEMVKVWEKSQTAQLYRVFDIQSLKLGKTHSIFIKLFSEGNDADKTIVEKKVYLSFSLGEIDYFTEGIINLDETDGNLVLSLSKSLYRSEKRGDERLLTFPHHEVYAYFKIKKIDEDSKNVLPLAKEEDEIFLNYKKAKKEKLKELLEEYQDERTDLIGFRAMDISRSGIAFTIGKEESGYFDTSKEFAFIILFDGGVYNVDKSNVVYKVDFVSGGKNASDFKIGLKFDPIIELTKTINLILNSDQSSTIAQKEFEQFVDE